MPGLVFVESSCLVDTWSMAKQLVRYLITETGGLSSGRSDPFRVLDAEAARGTDLRAVHQALWGLLAGHEYRTLSEHPLVRSTGCLDRADPLGSTAARAVRAHRRAGDTIVVISELIPAFAQPLREHLGVDQVVCATPFVDIDGRLSGEFPDILLGPAAARAAERVAGQKSIPTAQCVAYGRDPRDHDLHRAVGHAVRIDYSGHLDPPVPLCTEITAPVAEEREHGEAQTWPRPDPLRGVLAELPAVSAIRLAG